MAVSPGDQTNIFFESSGYHRVAGQLIATLVLLLLGVLAAKRKWELNELNYTFFTLTYLTKLFPSAERSNLKLRFSYTYKKHKPVPDINALVRQFHSTSGDIFVSFSPVSQFVPLPTSCASGPIHILEVPQTSRERPTEGLVYRSPPLLPPHPPTPLFPKVALRLRSRLRRCARRSGNVTGRTL